MGYWSDKKVVVTGGAGFLGTHVIEKLQHAGCKQVYVVRSKDYDLTSQDAAADLFSDLRAGKTGWSHGNGSKEPPVDIVIHMAGLVGGIAANQARPADFFYQNLMMGVLTLHESWKAGATKFVAAGAGCGYPEHVSMPQKEENFWDGYPQKDSAPYSLAKRMLHIQSISYWDQHKFPAIVTIPGNIYGPHDNFDLEKAHVIPALIRKFVEATEPSAQPHNEVEVWGDGTPTRDFVYAGDVADGILLAGELYSRPALVNLSSGTETGIKQVIDHLTNISNFDGAIRWDTSRPNGQERRSFDVSKAKRELGWQARTSILKGLAKTTNWYRANRLIARNTG